MLLGHQHSVHNILHSIFPLYLNFLIFGNFLNTSIDDILFNTCTISDGEKVGGASINICTLIHHYFHRLYRKIIFLRYLLAHFF